MSVHQTPEVVVTQIHQPHQQVMVNTTWLVEMFMVRPPL